MSRTLNLRMVAVRSRRKVERAAREQRAKELERARRDLDFVVNSVIRMGEITIVRSPDDFRPPTMLSGGLQLVPIAPLAPPPSFLARVRSFCGL